MKYLRIIYASRRLGDVCACENRNLHSYRYYLINLPCLAAPCCFCTARNILSATEADEKYE